MNRIFISHRGILSNKLDLKHTNLFDTTLKSEAIKEAFEYLKIKKFKVKTTIL